MTAADREQLGLVYARLAGDPYVGNESAAESGQEQRRRPLLKENTEDAKHTAQQSSDASTTI